MITIISLQIIIDFYKIRICIGESVNEFPQIEQKGKTFDQEFDSSFPLFYSLLKKGKKKGRIK